MFDWAKQPSDKVSQRKASTAMDSEVDADTLPKIALSSDDEKDDDDDPIGKLLKSNTSIFGVKQELLQP